MVFPFPGVRPSLRTGVSSRKDGMLPLLALYFCRPELHAARILLHRLFSLPHAGNFPPCSQQNAHPP